jgi:hypothetical protein
LAADISSGCSVSVSESDVISKSETYENNTINTQSVNITFASGKMHISQFIKCFADIVFDFITIVTTYYYFYSDLLVKVFGRVQRCTIYIYIYIYICIYVLY